MKYGRGLQDKDDRFGLMVRVPGYKADGHGFKFSKGQINVCVGPDSWIL